MIGLFKSTRFCQIAGYVILTVCIVLEFNGVIPHWLGWILLIVIAGLEYLIVWWSVKKYNKICDKANFDLETFIIEQDMLAKRSKKLKMIIDGNTITALINHEQIDEAQRRLIIYGQNIMPNDLMSRYQYSSELVSIAILKRDFSHIDFYINDMKMCVYQMAESRMPGLTSKMKTRLELVIEELVSEAEFYSRPVEILRGQDRQIALNYLDRIGMLYSIEKNVYVMRNFYITSLDYESGTVYAVLGDEIKAKEALQKVAKTNYTYPIVHRAKEYLASGDVSALLNNTADEH